MHDDVARRDDLASASDDEARSAVTKEGIVWLRGALGRGGRLGRLGSDGWRVVILISSFAQGRLGLGVRGCGGIGGGACAEDLAVGVGVRGVATAGSTNNRVVGLDVGLGGWQQRRHQQLGALEDFCEGLSARFAALLVQRSLEGLESFVDDTLQCASGRVSQRESESARERERTGE